MFQVRSPSEFRLQILPEGRPHALNDLSTHVLSDSRSRMLQSFQREPPFRLSARADRVIVSNHES